MNVLHYFLNIESHFIIALPRITACTMSSASIFIAMFDNGLRDPAFADAFLNRQRTQLEPTCECTEIKVCHRSECIYTDLARWESPIEPLQSYMQPTMVCLKKLTCTSNGVCDHGESPLESPCEHVGEPKPAEDDATQSQSVAQE